MECDVCPARGAIYSLNWPSALSKKCCAAQRGVARPPTTDTGAGFFALPGNAALSPHTPENQRIEDMISLRLFKALADPSRGR